MKNTVRNINIIENSSEKVYDIDEVEPTTVTRANEFKYKNMNHLRNQMEVNMNSIKLQKDKVEQHRKQSPSKNETNGLSEDYGDISRADVKTAGTINRKIK